MNTKSLQASTASSVVAFQKLIGENPDFRKALSHAKRAAKTDEPVLIVGASGTGKELLARAIHAASRREGKPFIEVNCSAIPDSLIESELFGYEKGAFTGANASGKKGYFDEAHEGTLLLDEIGDASLQVQAKLLRVLEDGCFKRIGGNQNIKVDVRIISSTNRDMMQLMAVKQMREDLFYRLNTFTIQLPSLIERGEDIQHLINHFLNLYSKRDKKDLKLQPSTLRILEGYRWPGNVRELRGVIAYAVSMTDGVSISPRALPVFFHNKSSMPRDTVESCSQAIAHSSIQDFNLKKAVSRIEKELIQEALLKWDNRTDAIKALGISRRSFYMKLKQYNIRKQHYIEND